MTPTRTEIRLALPSRGRLAQDALDLLAEAGLRVHKPNPRQYEATIPSLPGLTVLFQRAGDIVVSVRDGSVDFGITGWDVVSEQGGGNHQVLTLVHDLGFGFCTLNVIVPESWESVRCMSDLADWQAQNGRAARVATKFPNLTQAFFHRYGLQDVRLISAEGTLEIAPTIGYADAIVDLVSTGTTLRDNRLRILEDGLILESQACLIANREALKTRPEVLVVARQLLEFIIAHLRATENVAVFANVRGETPEAIGARMTGKPVIGGLQGPTISRVVTRENGGWFAVHIIVRKNELAQACLIANREALKTRPDVLAVARQLLEFIIAHLRATENVAVFANVRGETPEAIGARMTGKPVIGGLQGPTISPVVTRENGGWFAVHIIVRKNELAQAITELREIGGSGVVVMPVTYIFEEEPQAYKAMLAALAAPVAEARRKGKD